MTGELAVWLFADKIGTLALRDGELSFQYSTEWLANPAAHGISATLPLRAARFNDRESRPYFAGLLPEGRLRQLIGKQFQVSGQNDFALLDRIGGECAGAVTLLRPGQTPQEQASQAITQWLETDELADMLDRLPRRPMLAGEDGLRLSLAGAQDKLPVVFDGTRIGLPKNGAPSSHILKPAIGHLEDTVTNEWFCLATAEALNLGPSRATIGTAKGKSFLLVERYDRRLDERGRRYRLHQEDFCQALGVVPELKYQNEGGPDFAQSFELLRRATRPSAPEVLRLLDYAIFNTLIGNHDAHAKNYSLLYTQNGTRLAPLYDVVATAIYPDLSPKMAMKIGGKYKFSEVYDRHWEQFIDAAALGKAPARKRLIELARQLPEATRNAQKQIQVEPVSKSVIEQIIRLVDKRCDLTLRRLSNS